MAQWKKSYTSILVIVLILVVWTIIFTHIDIRAIVDRIGTTNGYLLAVGIALSGGISVFTTATFFSAMGLLSIGGLNPLVLGLVTAPALALGDYLFYYLGKKGKAVISPAVEKKVARAEAWFAKRPPFLILLAVYAYTAFAPLPAEVLMISLALLGYPFRKALPVIILGHITIVTWLGYLAIVTGPSLGF